MSGRVIPKEVFRLRKNIHSISNGQAEITYCEISDTDKSISVEIAPNAGPYYGGKFTFLITIGDDYPDQPPAVGCETPIFHPNIDPTCNGSEDNICLNLFSEWQSSFGLEDCVQGFLFLLHNPNLEDPLSPLFEPTLSEEEFLNEVTKTLKTGCTIDSVVFEKNWHLGEDILELDEQSKVELTSDLETKRELEDGNESDVTENNNTRPASESNVVSESNGNTEDIPIDGNVESEDEKFNETTVSSIDIMTDVEKPPLILSRQSSKIERLWCRDEQVGLTLVTVDNTVIGLNNEINPVVAAKLARISANVPNNVPYFVDSDPTVKLITNVLYSIIRKAVFWYNT